MKKLLTFTLSLVFLLSAFPSSAKAYKTGDVVGFALTTDIAATINGYDIPSYNVDGYTYIVAEDLRYYGFSVNYDNSTRSLAVSRDLTQQWVSKEYIKPYVSSSKVGQRAHSLLYTDIKTYFDGSYVESYNISGQTIIKFDALNAYGSVSYDNNKREISLNLSGLNVNPSPVDRASASVLDSMSSAEKREVNVFLSNFSEAYYNPADNYYTDPAEQKINFAYIHAKINSYSYIIFDNGYYGISAANVDKILKRFFGSTVSHTTPSNSKWWKYKDGNFLFPAADGESYPDFSIATAMYANGNDTYTVEFSIYSDPSVSGGDSISNSSVYSLTPSQASAGYDYVTSGTAIIKPKVYNNSNTYELVDYTVNYSW